MGAIGKSRIIAALAVFALKRNTARFYPVLFRSCA